ncbi:MAG: hypothetical protein DCF20_00400 [Pseudanabaena sp.]|nr:MAG: hypothetical protein DCF20_00400 [Pseudanabaena sp.]
METLFRFVLTRPAIAQDQETPSIRLAQGSQFQAALGQAQNSDNLRESLKSVARQFTEDSNFVGDPKVLPIYEALKNLSATLDELEQQECVTHDDVSNAIANTFDANPNDLVEEGTLNAPIAFLKDSLIAIKLLPEEHQRPIEDLTRQLRDLELILKVAATKDFPYDGAVLRRYRRRSLMLPSETDLRSSLSTSKRQEELEQQRKEAEARKRAKAERKLARFKQLNTAFEELINLGAEHLQSTQQEEDDGFLVPEAQRSTEVFVQELIRYQQGAQNAQEQGEGINIRSLSNSEAGEPSIASVFPQSLLLQTGSSSFKPSEFGEVSFRLKSTATRSLSSDTVELLDARQVNIAERPLDQIVQQLQSETMALSKELDSLLGRPVQRTFKRMGNTMVVISTPMPTVWNSMVIGNDLTFPPYAFSVDDRVPRSRGSVAPAGVADLLVIKQQLVRYEGTDVAHIESVLKGEHKEREHIRRRETEELTFRETEITTSEERELESTNRFEMSRETGETIKEDASLKAGLTISGKYGPTVEFSASAEGSLSRSKEEAMKSAANFSQDVTQRSANKITERVLERSSLRVTNEVTEKNNHTLDNVGGAGNISGVYQWVNKVYQAQMFNYGLRVMYDFMLPEPGAFLIAALQSTHTSAIAIEKPTPFTLRPDQITEMNYHNWVQQYGATDVQPPPDLYKTKSMNFKLGPADSNTSLSHSAETQVDEGYKAVHIFVRVEVTIWDPNHVVDVALGGFGHRFFASRPGTWSQPIAAQDYTSIPFALVAWKVSSLAGTVVIKCQRTDRAMMKWRLDTHAKLTQAYKARLSEYEEKLASLELQAGVAIRGRNPALNIEVMKDELKKNCISILTEQHFDLFDAISSGSNGLPQINLFENAAEGPYVRFFEQAFEWEQMTWVTYPYFWGRKNQWEERIAYEDVDPVFNQFLKAGYCRVVVPARLGFEGAIDHFMSYGEIWEGGPLPPISSPIYLPIADEIAERLERPGDEIPQDDPWPVRIPTTLVYLRADDKLPKWEQDANGDWIEA